MCKKNAVSYQFLLQVYVGGLDPNVSEDELRKAFAKYGDVASVKIPVGKQCGFVQFVNRYYEDHFIHPYNNLLDTVVLIGSCCNIRDCVKMITLLQS